MLKFPESMVVACVSRQRRQGSGNSGCAGSYIEMEARWLFWLSGADVEMPASCHALAPYQAQYQQQDLQDNTPEYLGLLQCPDRSMFGVS